MNYTLENEYLRAGFDTKGAELVSLFGKKTGTEYVWYGDPAYWGEHAPIMFPICSRLFEGKYTYGGKTYEMPLHGFVRYEEFQMVEKSENSITFEYLSNEKTRAQYPFEFSFRMTYTLEGNKLENRFTVENRGEEILPFSYGGHTGFNVPFAKGEQFDDYYIEFAEPAKVTKWEFSPRRLYTGNELPVPLENDRVLPLRHELFDSDAIFFCHMPETVSLRSRKNSRSVTVNYPGMPHLGLWHMPKTDAPFVCIEPWHGMPAIDGVIDDFATKPEMIRLDAGKTYTSAFTITVND